MNACMMSSREVMTKGPCCTTGSPMGLPWRRSNSTSPSPVASRGTLASPRSSRPVCSLKTLPSAVSSEPLKKKTLRRVVTPPRAAGRVHLLLRSSLMVTMATSDSSTSRAYDAGGGVGTVSSSLASMKPRPATTAMVVEAEPEPSDGSVACGISSLQSILKWGSAILSFLGRLSHIWKSSRRFSPSLLSKGNISLWEMPRPAVIHCASPPSPKRPAEPRESQWSTIPCRTRVTVSKPRCGCLGKPGTLLPWYMFHPVGDPKSEPSARPRRSSRGGPMLSSPRGYASSW
mmetsp:Transcript_23742/g.64390  ORF Transcript_23742/g.64390 Transcript_23742/m.64390 type:complete len:288 (-) Transcript_23742:98-961(-)